MNLWVWPKTWHISWTSITTVRALLIKQQASPSTHPHVRIYSVKGHCSHAGMLVLGFQSRLLLLPCLICHCATCFVFAVSNEELSTGIHYNVTLADMSVGVRFDIASAQCSVKLGYA